MAHLAQAQTTESAEAIALIDSALADTAAAAAEVDQLSSKSVSPNTAIISMSQVTFPPISSTDLICKVRAILNKVAHSTLDTLSRELLNIVDSSLAQTQTNTEASTRQEVAELFIVHAVAGEQWAGLYAQLALVLVKGLTPNIWNDEGSTSGGNLFKRHLLGAIQAKFDSIMGALVDPLPAPRPRSRKATIRPSPPPQSNPTLNSFASFLSQAFLHDLVPEHILHNHIRRLLFPGNEITSKLSSPAKIEAVCKILGAVGETVDLSTGRATMDQYFHHMEKVLLKQSTAVLAYRSRFQLMDLIEARARRWNPRVPETPASIPSILLEESDADANFKPLFSPNMNAVVEDGIHFEIIKDRHKPPHSIHAELLSHPLLKQGAFHYGDELSAPRTPIQVRGAQFEMLGAPDNLLSPMTVGASVTSAEAELDSMVNSPATAGFLMPIPASPFDDPLSTAPTSESELETDVTSTLSRHARLFVKMRDLDRAESTFADMKSSQRSKLIDLLVMEALCAENGTLAKAVAQLFRRLETKTICGASAFIRGFERGMQLVCQESNMGSKPIQKKKFNEMAMFLAVMLWGCAMTAASIRQLQLFANFQSTRDLLISNMEQVEAQDNLFEIWREVTPYVYTGHPSPRSVPSISSPSRYSTHEGEIEDGESLLDNDDESDDIESYYMDEDELRAPPSSSEEEVDWGYCDIHGGYCGHTHD